MQELLRYLVTAILTFEARILLRRVRPKIVGVTGSVGKTTTKDAIYTVLKHKLHVRKSEKSFNSSVGVTLSILGLQNAWYNPWHWFKNLVDGAFHAFFDTKYPEVLVLEMSVDRPGDMQVLTQLVRPDVAVVTNVPDLPAHVEFFPSPAAVHEEKFALVQALKTDGVYIYNNDDERLREYTAAVRQPAFGYSRYSPSHFHAHADKILYDGGFPSGIEFTVTHLEEEVRVALQGVLGVQHSYNIAAALAVGYQFGVGLDEGAEALKGFKPAPGRMRLLSGQSKTLIVDDSYNSSPVAAHRALETLREIKAPKRRVAILGDMLELGKYSVREHERIGVQAAEVADVLITIGLRSRQTAQTALENGLSEKCVFQYDTADRLAAEVSALTAPEDIILVKGSQRVRAERVVKALMADPGKAEELLVRQDKAWLRKP